MKVGKLPGKIKVEDIVIPDVFVKTIKKGPVKGPVLPALIVPAKGPVKERRKTHREGYCKY